VPATTAGIRPLKISGSHCCGGTKAGPAWLGPRATGALRWRRDQTGLYLRRTRRDPPRRRPQRHDRHQLDRGAGRALPGWTHTAIWGAAFAALCVWQALVPGFVAGSRVLSFLGERSFSIYLLHPLVMIFLRPLCEGLTYVPCALVVLAAVYACAAVTYAAIERPGMAVGAEMIGRMRSGVLVQDHVGVAVRPADCSRDAAEAADEESRGGGKAGAAALPVMVMSPPEAVPPPPELPGPVLPVCSLGRI
jgi:hypothetical protein